MGHRSVRVKVVAVGCHLCKGDAKTEAGKILDIHAYHVGEIITPVTGFVCHSIMQRRRPRRKIDFPCCRRTLIGGVGGSAWRGEGLPVGRLTPNTTWHEFGSWRQPPGKRTTRTYLNLWVQPFVRIEDVRGKMGKLFAGIGSQWKLWKGSYDKSRLLHWGIVGNKMWKCGVS